MAFTQSPSLRNNPKILNNDSTVPSLQMTLYVFGFVLCFVIKMITIFDLMSQGWSVLWWGWWKFGDETDDNDQIDDKRKISPVDGPWQPSRLCTNLGRDTLTTHFRKYRYLFGELPKLARLSLWGLLLYTSYIKYTYFQAYKWKWGLETCQFDILVSSPWILDLPIEISIYKKQLVRVCQFWGLLNIE